MPAPSVVAGADVTLLAARQLLNNPPPSGASPSAVEEWRRTVDQLIVAAINTPLHERRCQPSAQYSHTPQRHMRHPQPVRRLLSTLLPLGQMPTKRCGIAHRWRVTRRPTSGLKSIVAVVEKMAESPSSTGVRGVEISRAAISKKISTLTRRRVRVHPHVRHIPLAPRELRGGGGVHGVGTTSTDGGLATQVPAPPAGEV
jgi:hypothetical protein